MHETERLAYNVSETARALGLSRQAIYNLIKAGRLDSVKLGGNRRLVTRTSIDRLLSDTTYRRRNKPAS